MKSRTGGIIGTVAAGLLCGIPGIILACTGVLAIAGGGQSTGSAGGAQNTLIGAIAFLVGGAVLALIPIAVGFFALRRRESSPSAPAMPPAPSAPARPAPQPAGPIPASVVQPAAAAASASAAPAASSSQAAPSGMDPAARVVYDRIMALNRPTAPYQILDGKAENVDLIAEWKIVDAKWYEIFAKANLSKVFRIHMKLDPARREVRAQDHEFTVSWKAGIPSLSFSASTFRGQQSSVSVGTAYAFTEDLAPGQVYKYRFNTNELKKPIQDAVAACGWKYKGVAFGKL